MELRLTGRTDLGGMAGDLLTDSRCTVHFRQVWNMYNPGCGVLMTRVDQGPMVTHRTGQRGFGAACLLHRHRNVAEVSRRQGSELLLPDAEVGAARVYLLHHHRLAAAHTDSLQSQYYCNTVTTGGSGSAPRECQVPGKARLCMVHPALLL